MNFDKLHELNLDYKELLGDKRRPRRDLSSILASVQNLANGKKSGYPTTTTSINVLPSTTATTLPSSLRNNNNNNLRIDDMELSTVEVTPTQIANS